MEVNSTRGELAEAYRDANTSLAIECTHMSSEDLAMQQRVIDGELMHERFREHVIAAARDRGAAPRPIRV